MSGSLATKYRQLTAFTPLVSQIEEAHNFAANPRFGGELEVMALTQNEEGRLIPVGYHSSPNEPAMSGFLTTLIEAGNFTVNQDIDGNPIRLTSDQGEIVSFEHYAAVIERADTSYPGINSSLTEFGNSLDRFAVAITDFAAKNDIKLSPFDFDTFCEPEDFDGKNAPSERFGEGGMLDFYDASHPLNELIDRHTSSSHFSVGYKSPEHLWRQIKVMTKLTPALYAAFASSAPTMEVTLGGEKTILPKNKALELQKDGADITLDEQLLVPRARLWTLADASRTGINETIAEIVFDPQSTLQDMIQIIVDQPTIMYGEDASDKTFREVINEGEHEAGTPEYMKHVSTLWYDIRVDLLRLEARMAGSAPWISKAMGSLMTTMMMDDSALSDIEDALDSLGLEYADLLSARHDVGSKGLETQFGKDHTLKTALSEVCDVLKPHMSAVAKDFVEPLEFILEAGQSNSEFLASIEAIVQGDYTDFLDLDYTSIAPLAQMHQNGDLDHILNRDRVQTHEHSEPETDNQPNYTA